MDPSLATNFVPPSEQDPEDRVPALAPSSLIPNVSPIQPYVLADYNAAIDAPPPHSVSRSGSLTSTSKTYTEELDELRDSLRHVAVSDNSKDQRLTLHSCNSPRETSSTTSCASPVAHPFAANTPKSPATEIKRVIKLGTTSPYSADTNGARPVINSADLEEVPVGVSRQARDLRDYKFPTHRLAPVMQDEKKFPLLIVACGSFSPITYLHLRMFEMAMDSIRESTQFEVVGGYYSPVSDHYKKAGLAPSRHRVRMCELACERTSSWLMVDAWESLQPCYQRTAVVLDHFNEELNVKRKGVKTRSGRRKDVKIMLLAGGDLIESMGEPNVWAEDDLHHILGRYGCLIVERTGSDVRSFLLSHDVMYEHRRNVLVIKQLIYNDISSTKVRLFIRRGMSVQYLLPNSVIRYIIENGLYIHESEPVKQVMSERGD